MYTPPKFDSEEAARSQVEPLQIQPGLMQGYGNCSNGGRKYMPGLLYKQARVAPLQLSRECE